jgi:hypothetical protein
MTTVQDTQANENPEPTTTTIKKKQDFFEGLRRAMVENAGGDFLRLQDGEYVVATVQVVVDPDPTKQTPRFEEVDNYNKTGKVRKMRLDLEVGTGKKVFYVGSQAQRQVIALLQRDVRRIKISRFGSTAQNTRYVFEAHQ